jgi:uncharacterized protein
MTGLQHYALFLSETPLLLVCATAPTEAARRGTVLFIHGLGADKERNRPELDRFARAGFLAVGLDAVGHGERRYPDFEARFGGPAPERERALIETVVGTARELPWLIHLLQAAGLAHEGGVGLCGVSMGGFVGYGAVPLGGINALVALLASPAWRAEVPEHPEKHLGRYPPCALLSIVAGKDEFVSPHEAPAFHQRLQPHYAANPERLGFLAYPDSGHFMREEDWDDALTRAIAWFDRFLLPSRR